MVYGPGSVGNFLRLVKLVDAGIPLPLGKAIAPKSFVFIDNLISAVDALLARTDVRTRAFVVCDAEVTSTAGLVRHAAAALGKPARLVPVPQIACQLLGRMTGSEQDIVRMFEPLQMTALGLSQQLQWRPPNSLADGVRSAVVSWQMSRA